MTYRDLPEKFTVAFSFAGEQRELVRTIAEGVEKNLGRSTVFFDEWYEHHISGQDADLKLQKIYCDDCLLAVICISERYGRKPWTRAEYRAIRARQMKAENGNNEQSSYGILPIRVGDGEVEGILFNAIVEDVRDKSIEETIELIVNRVELVSSKYNFANDAEPPKRVTWLEKNASLFWPLANHHSVRDSFSALLRHDVSQRFLPIRGSSELGKSHIAWQMFHNVRHGLMFPCGRFDFKGTINIDMEIRTFFEDLDVHSSHENLNLVERLNKLLNALKERGEPALLIFDTYEAASAEAQRWMERQLLPSIIHQTWLRVVICGQRIPSHTGVIWETCTARLIDLKSPPADDWFEYGKKHKAGLTLEQVTTVGNLVGYSPTLMALILGPSV